MKKELLQSREEYLSGKNLREITQQEIEKYVKLALELKRFDKIEDLRSLSVSLDSEELSKKINATDELKSKFFSNLDELVKFNS